jgi:hypothetical protein
MRSLPPSLTPDQTHFQAHDLADDQLQEENPSTQLVHTLVLNRLATDPLLEISCPICLEAILDHPPISVHSQEKTGEVAIRIFQGRVEDREHLFHQHCIQQAYQNNPNCPLCHHEMIAFDLHNKAMKTLIAKLRQNGLELAEADLPSRANRSVVLAAVEQNGEALQFASEQLRADPSIAQIAILNTLSALKSIDPSIRSNPTVIRAAQQSALATQRRLGLGHGKRITWQLTRWLSS